MPRARCARRWGNGRRGLPSKPRYWAMCDHLRTDLPLAALAMAIAARRPSRPDPPICLGRVSQTDATRRLAVAKLTAIDNAPMESFFHILKTEFVHHRRYATRAEATRDIFAHIEGFYNRNASPLRHRLHQPARDRAKGSLTLSIFSGEAQLAPDARAQTETPKGYTGAYAPAGTPPPHTLQIRCLRWLHQPARDRAKGSLTLSIFRGKLS
jgi:hypothetical protein